METITLGQVMAGVVALAGFISAIGIILKEARKPIKSLEDKVVNLQNNMESRLQNIETSMDNRFSAMEAKTEKIGRDLALNMRICKYLVDISPVDSDKLKGLVAQSFSEAEGSK